MARSNAVFTFFPGAQTFSLAFASFFSFRKRQAAMRGSFTSLSWNHQPVKAEDDFLSLNQVRSLLTFQPCECRIDSAQFCRNVPMRARNVYNVRALYCAPGHWRPLMATSCQLQTASIRCPDAHVAASPSLHRICPLALPEANALASLICRWAPHGSPAAAILQLG